jgi:DNA-binding HxlR family transcriptional regulator
MFDRPSTNQTITKQERVNPDRLCPSTKERTAQLAINLIHGKWKMEILCELQHGPIRLSRLRKALPEASRKMLTRHLREMEKDDLILRTDFSSRLRHVEYSLSESHGLAILQLIDMRPAGARNIGPEKLALFRKRMEGPEPPKRVSIERLTAPRTLNLRKLSVCLQCPLRNSLRDVTLTAKLSCWKIEYLFPFK